MDYIIDCMPKAFKKYDILYLVNRKSKPEQIQY